RLHDLFVNVEGMTPGEYKNGGEKLEINYSFADSPFGNLIIASTHKGICHMAFVEDQDRALDELRSHFEKAGFKQHMDKIQQDALFIFQEDWSMPQRIRLHLKGTAFQLKVWDSLLKVPLGKLVTYGQLADTIGTSGASRLVGTAVGSNPVAFLIPCHRVIRSNGQSGEYRWGGTRKSAMIGWEAAKLTS